METVRALLGAALLLFASVYLGTGVTLVFFLYPIAPRLTPQTYKLPFVEPVRAATRTFTVMTLLMLAGGLALTGLEFDSGRWPFPAAYVLLTTASTLLTTRVLFRLNDAMAVGIDDPVELQSTLKVWRKRNSVRASLWAAEWITMMTWFILRST